MASTPLGSHPWDKVTVLQDPVTFPVPQPSKRVRATLTPLPSFRRVYFLAGRQGQALRARKRDLDGDRIEEVFHQNRPNFDHLPGQKGGCTAPVLHRHKREKKGYVMTIAYLDDSSP